MIATNDRIDEVQTQIDVNIAEIQNLKVKDEEQDEEIRNIKDGTLIVKQAEQDQLGNVINLTYETKADANLSKVRITLLENANMLKDVVYNNVNGVLTFTRYDDTTKQIDLPLELLVESGYYDEVANELVFV